MEKYFPLVGRHLHFEDWGGRLILHSRSRGQPQGVPCVPVGPQEPQGLAQESTVGIPQSPIPIGTAGPVLSGVLASRSDHGMVFSGHPHPPGWMAVSGKPQAGQDYAVAESGPGLLPSSNIHEVGDEVELADLLFPLIVKDVA